VAEEKSGMQRLLDMRAKNVEQLPSFGGQLRGLGREMCKDINDKMHQVFFGQGAGMNEPGTPLSPTQAMITKDLGTVHGYQTMLDDAALRAEPDRQQGIER
jgi:hypothetical protein